MYLLQHSTAENGYVIHKETGKKSGYGELVAIAAKLNVPTDVPLKHHKDFKLIGQPISKCRKQKYCCW